MRVVIQRVLRAEVTAAGEVVGSIDSGLLVYVGVGKGDGAGDVAYTADKLVGLRIFADEAGKMNLSVRDVGGGILVVSNFTLYGDCRKGRRPSFDESAGAEQARELYSGFLESIKVKGVGVAGGEFGEYMQVKSVNDGPVTFFLDSRVSG